MTCNKCGDNGYTGCVTEPDWCECIGGEGRSKAPVASYGVEVYGKGIVQLQFKKDWPNGNHDHWYAYQETIGL